MIVQIAGTSGSGKSHLVRSILDFAASEGDCEEDKAKGKTDGYKLTLPKVPGQTYVLGPYDVPTGGCDTKGSAIEVYKLLPLIVPQYRHVIFEGLFVMNMTRGPQLAAEYAGDFVVIQLDTPLATCLASVNERRAARGAGKLEDTSNTEDNFRRARNYCAKMRDAGARVIKMNREEALGRVLALLEA